MDAVVLHDMSAWRLSAHGWFTSAKCLHDFAAIHAPQISPAYKRNPPYQMDTAIIDAYVKRAVDVANTVDTRTDEKGVAIRDSDKEAYTSVSLGFYGAPIESRNYDDNHDDDSDAESRGFYVIRTESSKAVWLMPLATLFNNMPSHIAHVSKRICRKLITPHNRGGEGHHHHHHVISTRDVQFITTRIMTKWAFLQYALFHVLVVDALMADAAIHPDHWYVATSETSTANNLSGMSQLTHALRNGHTDVVASMQTYITWWWKTFQLESLFEGDETLATDVFQLLHKAIVYDSSNE